MTSVEDYYANAQLEAKRANFLAQDDDPDNAAEALSLSEDTGVPAPAIHDNLDEFKQQHKIKLANGIIDNNEFIAEYLSAHPLAASVSHDDLGNIDNVHRELDNFKHESSFATWAKNTAVSSIKAMATPPKAFEEALTGMTTPPKAFEEAMEGFGAHPFGAKPGEEGATPIEKATGIYSRPDDVSWALSHPTWAASIGRMTGVGELGAEGMARVTNALIDYGRDNIASTFGESTAKVFETAAQALVDPATQETLMSSGHPVGAVSAGVLRGAEVLSEFLHATRIAKAWHDIGKEVPPNLNPRIDEAKKLQAKVDIDAITRSLQKAQESDTREKFPDYFANAIRAKVGEREIGIEADAIRALYGDKVPEAGDNLLGWIPDLGKKLEAAELTGGDVSVPLADWLAKADPEIHKTLADDIRAREAGLTVNETKIEAEPKTVGPDTLQQIRGAAGLEPMEMAGDRNVELRLKPPAAKDAEMYKTAGLHDVEIYDEYGKNIGMINLSLQKDGKRIYIDMINAGPKESKFYQPNYLGPSLIMDIRRQLKAMFPGAEEVTGHRVSGARDKAGEHVIMDPKKSMPVIKLEEGSFRPDHMRELLGNFWEPTETGHFEALRGPKTLDQQVLSQAIESELRRLIPQKLGKVDTPLALRRAAGRPGQVGGFYSPSFERFPEIMVALDRAAGALGIARHEAIHMLRGYGFFTDKEWATLERAARDGDWIKKYRIDKRYGHLDTPAQLEEAIAEGFRDWAEGQKARPEVHGIFERLKQLFESIKTKFKELTGKDLNYDEIFQKTMSGEVGAREGTKPIPHRGGNIPFDIKEMADDKGIFEEGKGMGVTQSHMDRLLRNIDNRNKEDFEYKARKAEVAQRRRSNREFKERRTTLRDEVSESLRNRPDLAVDALFAKQKIKINPAYLTEDQRARLPKDYLQTKDGINPDDLAPYFGYTSGDAMVERLGVLTENRRRTGMSQRDYFNRVVDVETDRRLNQEFGDREQHVLDEAKDQALSETQLNMVHEDTLQMAMKAGEVPKLTKEQVRAGVKAKFDEQTMGSIKSDKFLQAAGKIGKKIEEALNAGKFQDAYRLSQQRHHATLYAKFARDAEKLRTSFDHTAKSARRREMPGVTQEFTNWVHDLLVRVGKPINRSVQDLATEGIGRQTAKTLADFAEAKKAEWQGMRTLPIEDWIKDPSMQIPIDKMTYEQFRQFKSAIDGLIKAGRDEGKVYHEGQAFDRKQLVGEFVNQVETFDGKLVKPGYEPGVTKRYVAGISALATVMRRFDRGDRYGKFQRFITNRAAHDDNYFSRIVREVAKDQVELNKDIGDLSKTMDTPPELRRWGDMYSGFTRENHLSLISNAGNISNWRVAIEGYGGDPVKAWADLIKNSTKEDWDRAQAFGDQVYGKLAKLGDGVVERVRGSSIEKIQLEEFTIRFPDGRVGTYKGWYHPLFQDKLLKGKQHVRMGDLDPDYGHIATYDGWTKKRTGAVYPVDLSYSQMPYRLEQVIHDITHRETVLEIQKIFRDPKLHEAITKHYGKEYTDLLMPWLEDLAGKRGVPAGAWGAITQASNAMRNNAVNTYISFNPSTPAKHFPTAFFMSAKELGWKNMPAFLEAYKQLKISPARKQWQALVNSSEEIQRREVHWEETFGGVQLKMYDELPWKEKMTKWGAYVVAKSDRFSADALWLARYNLEMADHGIEGIAREQADLSVRRAHGSTAPSNKPELVRRAREGFNPWLTTVYGFMGERMQRLIETVHSANDFGQFVKKGEIDKAAREIMTGTIPNYLIYVVAVGAIEEGVNAYFSESHEGPLTRLAKIGLGNIGSSFFFMRDFINAAERGEIPDFGMFTTAARDFTQPVRDVMKGKQAWDRQHAGKTVKDFLVAAGIAKGVAPKTIDNAIQFAIDQAAGQPKPKNMHELSLGITRGDIHRKKQR